MRRLGGWRVRDWRCSEGDAAEAKRFVGEAVKNAAAYPHPRGRAMGLFETALYFLEERQEAAEEVLGELKK
jgi:hypothetical protein